MIDETTLPGDDTMPALVFAFALFAQDPVPSGGDAQRMLLQAVAEEHGKTAEVDEVFEHLKKMVQSRKVHGQSWRVLQMLEQPFDVPLSSSLLCQQLLPGEGASPWPELGHLPGDIQHWFERGSEIELRVQADRSELAEYFAPLEDPEVQDIELLEALSAYVAELHDQLSEGLEALGLANRERLFSGHGEFSEAWYGSHDPQRSAEEAAAQARTMAGYQSVLVRTDLEPVLRAAAGLLRLTAPDFQQGLAKRLTRTRKQRTRIEGFEGDVRAVVGQTPESRVVLGGRGRTIYSGDAAVIVDLDGKDVYHRAAVVDDAACLVRLVLDLGGDDLYESEGAGPAYAVGGVALVYDREGDDVYRGRRHAQACSAAGFAMLVDIEGDDVYEAEDYAQAYALCGVSLLYDLAGDDRYRAWSYAQGAGNGDGFSALVDVAGDDDYLADEHWPDVYGDSGPNVYHGAAQGFSLGFRGNSPEIAGGVAVLLDAEGKDRYQAGNFSQGGGYYFGFGLMFDGGGDDVNVGTRYSQGFGVHQAVGMRWDAGGDDQYRTRCAANCGTAWDEGVGWLWDESGDDVYEAGGLALGGAAQTAFAFFLDGGGKDSYRSGGGAGDQGGAGSSEYHDKPSVGFLVDLGGSKDQYSRAGRDNGISLSSDWVGLFLDARARSIEEYLEKRRSP